MAYLQRKADPGHSSANRAERTDDADQTADLRPAVKKKTKKNGTSRRPHGAPCSPAHSHNRHISRRLAPTAAPTAAGVFFSLTPVNKLCFPFQ